MSKAILTDITKCIGCLECVTACKLENNLESESPKKWQKNDGLSAKNWTSIIQKQEDHYIRKQCRHCLEPACVSACLVGAMQKTKEGPVIYNGDRCIGCRYCMVACPYGIPRYDWEQAVPYVQKCNMCYTRLKQGQQPACIEACPEKVSVFGPRDKLLEVAKARLAAHPEKYQPKVYGETEIGGTSVLYIADMPLDFLAFKPEMGDTPLPVRTMAALSKVPPLVLGMGGLMTGVYWFIGRRMRLQAEREKEKAAQLNAAASPQERENEP